MNKYTDSKSKKLKKFTLKDRLDQLTSKDRALANKILPGILGISKAKYNRLIYANIDSNQEIAGVNLIQLANYFGCKPEELYSDPPPKIELNTQVVGASLNLTR